MGKNKGTLCIQGMENTGEDLISGTCGHKAGLKGWVRDREYLTPEKEILCPLPQTMVLTSRFDDEEPETQDRWKRRREENEVTVPQSPLKHGPMRLWHQRERR